MDQTQNKQRNDLPRLRYLKGMMEKYVPNFKMSFKEEEDYKIDCAAELNDREFPLEAKTNKENLFDKYVNKKDCEYKDSWLLNLPFDSIRYNQNRYLTQEQVRKDRTPKPDWLCKGTPMVMLNASSAREDVECKWDRILKQGGGACYLYKDSIVFFTPEALNNAFLGYVWIYMYPSKECKDRKNNNKSWECKALFDVTKSSYRIVNINTPKELVS